MAITSEVMNQSGRYENHCIENQNTVSIYAFYELLRSLKRLNLNNLVRLLGILVKIC